MLGSDRADPGLIDEVERQFRVPVVQFYGLSEVSPLVAVTPRTDENISPGSVGRIDSVWSVATLDADGRSQPPTLEGEIAVKGGFFNLAIGRTNSRISSEGFLCTGDRGFVDQRGDLFLTGRVDDRIYRGGEKIDPRSVEEPL